MMWMINMDEQILILEKQADELMVLMHEAPMNELRTDADGHRWIGTNSQAYADRSREWCRVMDKIDVLKSINDSA